jgi:hypothetical protein
VGEGAEQHLSWGQHAPGTRWSSKGRARPMQRRGDEWICCSGLPSSSPNSSISAEFLSELRPRIRLQVPRSALTWTIRRASRMSAAHGLLPLPSHHSLVAEKFMRACLFPLVCARAGSLAHSSRTRNKSRISARLMTASSFIEPGAATSTRRRAGVVSSPTHPRPGKTAPTMMPTGAETSPQTPTPYTLDRLFRL